MRILKVYTNFSVLHIISLVLWIQYSVAKKVDSELLESEPLEPEPLEPVQVQEDQFNEPLQTSRGNINNDLDDTFVPHNSQPEVTGLGDDYNVDEGDNGEDWQYKQEDNEVLEDPYDEIRDENQEQELTPTPTVSVNVNGDEVVQQDEHELQEDQLSTREGESFSKPDATFSIPFFSKPSQQREGQTPGSDRLFNKYFGGIIRLVDNRPSIRILTKQTKYYPKRLRRRPRRYRRRRRPRRRPRKKWRRPRHYRKRRPKKVYHYEDDHDEHEHAPPPPPPRRRPRYHGKHSRHRPRGGHGYSTEQGDFSFENSPGFPESNPGGEYHDSNHHFSKGHDFPESNPEDNDDHNSDPSFGRFPSDNPEGNPEDNPEDNDDHNSDQPPFDRFPNGRPSDSDQPPFNRFPNGRPSDSDHPPPFGRFPKNNPGGGYDHNTDQQHFDTDHRFPENKPSSNYHHTNQHFNEDHGFHENNPHNSDHHFDKDQEFHENDYDSDHPIDQFPVKNYARGEGKPPNSGTPFGKHRGYYKRKPENHYHNSEHNIEQNPGFPKNNNPGDNNPGGFGFTKFPSFGPSFASNPSTNVYDTSEEHTKYDFESSPNDFNKDKHGSPKRPFRRRPIGIPFYVRPDRDNQHIRPNRDQGAGDNREHNSYPGNSKYPTSINDMLPKPEGPPGKPFLSPRPKPMFDSPARPDRFKPDNFKPYNHHNEHEHQVPNKSFRRPRPFFGAPENNHQLELEKPPRNGHIEIDSPARPEHFKSDNFKPDNHHNEHEHQVPNKSFRRPRTFFGAPENNHHQLELEKPPRNGHIENNHYNYRVPSFHGDRSRPPPPPPANGPPPQQDAPFFKPSEPDSTAENTDVIDNKPGIIDNFRYKPKQRPYRPPRPRPPPQFHPNPHPENLEHQNRNLHNNPPPNDFPMREPPRDYGPPPPGPGFFMPPSRPLDFRRRRPMFGPPPSQNPNYHHPHEPPPPPNNYFDSPQHPHPGRRPIVMRPRPISNYNTQPITATHIQQPPNQPVPEIIYGKPMKPQSTQEQTSHDPPKQKLQLPIPYKPFPNYGNPNTQQNKPPPPHSNFIDTSNKHVESSSQQVLHKPVGVTRSMFDQLKELVFKFSPGRQQPIANRANRTSDTPPNYKITKLLKYSTLPDKLEYFKPDPSHKRLPKLTYDAMRRSRGPPPPPPPQQQQQQQPQSSVYQGGGTTMTTFTADDAINKKIGKAVVVEKVERMSSAASSVEDTTVETPSPNPNHQKRLQELNLKSQKGFKAMIKAHAKLLV